LSITHPSSPHSAAETPPPQMADRTIRHAPDYGASLRQQLDAIGWTQARLASESRVSRQTVSRAINQDEVSDRTRARIEAVLARAPARARSAQRHGTESRLAPSASPLCDATDLAAWADRRDAQSALPRLIRRLIRATGAGATRLQFRADEGVQLSGWDGIVHADEGGPRVPAGASGWEMTMAKRPKTAADKNWTKRTQDSTPLTPEDSAFVFVTPRRWPDKEKWAFDKIRQGPWRDVRVYDADDLAAWLEDAPAVHTWLSIKIGKIPPGTRDLRSYWETWSKATSPPLTPRFLLSGRQEAVAELHGRLSDVGSQAFAAQTESREEAVAWLYCGIRELGPDQAESVFSRCLVVESARALRHLTAARPPLILVPTFDPEDLAPAIARAGHAVVVPQDESDGGPGDDVIRLEPLDRQLATRALEDVGVDHSRAYKMAGLARRSLAAFRRSIAASPGLRRPEWSRPAVARGVVPALLAGSWKDFTDTDRESADREILSRLARRPYEEVVDALVPWSLGGDPLVRRKDDAWYLVSARDAWELLRPYIRHDDLNRFEEAAATVLGSVHPEFELPAEQRWMAGALGYSPRYSGLLRGGVAKSLASMGTRGAEVPTATASARHAAERVVRNLLENANEDWRLWASLSGLPPLLAEAAPDCFLDAVEADLKQPEPVLANLFVTTGDPMLGTAYHTGLLRALEVLAWSPDHLGRVVPILALLDGIDPESELRPDGNIRTRIAHRPLSVLRKVFRSWSPQTSATLVDRLAVLKTLGRSHGDVAWHVMRSMLPEVHSVGHPASRPSVREWAVDAGGITGRDEQMRTVSEVVQRMLDDAGSSGRRWTELLKHLHMLPRREHDLVVAALGRLDPVKLGEEARAAIWEALRSVIARNRAYSTAKWAMPERYLARLDRIRERFSPADPAALYGWLFGPRPRLVDGGDVDDIPWEEQKRRIAEARFEAVVAVLQGGGPDGLRAFARAVADPYELGLVAARMPPELLDPDELLSRHLADTEDALASLALGYVAGRSRVSGDEWAIGQLGRDDLELLLDQKVALLLALRARPRIWRGAARCGEDVSVAYWRRIPQRYFSDEHIEEAVLSLVDAGRPFVAADLLAFESRLEQGVVSPETVARVLDAAASASGDHDSPSGDFGSSAGLLLDVLVWADYDRTRVARLEWQLMPALSHHERPASGLHRLLAEDPDFFVEVVSLVYRAETEAPKEVSLEDERRAECGHSVLTEWKTIPGGRDRGGIDGARLRQWLDGASSSLTRADRVTIGHEVIGQMLSASPHDPDGTWPCAAIREVIEALDSTELERGFRVGVHNGRGVVMKDPSAGGAMERALAEQYDGFAVAVRAGYPRTARMLREIADSYRREAAQEDFQAEMVEEL